MRMYIAQSNLSSSSAEHFSGDEQPAIDNKHCLTHSVVDFKGIAVSVTWKLN